MARAVHERVEVIPLIAEAFRELGYDGATMSRITERTGLGKGSLYHFFPGGKEDMAAAVLADIDAWFEDNIFVPLREQEPRAAIEGMWRSVEAYFHSGRKVCLVGAFALDQTRDRFARAIVAYFRQWIDALAVALSRLGQPGSRELAEDVVSGIQGAIVLSRALGDRDGFSAAMARMRARLVPP
jgi:AcrR family transcriptional regulator